MLFFRSPFEQGGSFFASHKPKSIPRVLFLKDRIVCKGFFVFLYKVIFRSNLPRMQLRHS